MKDFQKSAKPAFSSRELKKDPFFSELVHRFGHDIGNPLTAIISLASVISRFDSSSIPEDQLHSFSSSILSESWKISDLNEQLVMLFSGKNVQSSICDVLPSTRRVFSLLERRGLSAEAVYLKCFSEKELLAAIDSAQFQRLIYELLKNSLTELEKLDDKQKIVRVSISDEDAKLVVRIINELKTEFTVPLEKLFESFVSFPEQSSSRGMGLTLAWAIVERAAGDITLRQRVESGSLFFEVEVSLPLTGGALLSDSEGGIETPATSISSNSRPGLDEAHTLPILKVLIIEDEDTIAKAISKILSISLRNTAEVCCVYDTGINVLNRLKNEDFCAILCDMNLEGANGQEIFATLKHIKPEALRHFAFITGESTGLHTGIFECPVLCKPFEAEELVELVKRLAGI